MAVRTQRLARGLGRLLLAGAMVYASAPASAGLTAGAARATIAITPDMLPLDGFGTVHDPLSVRVTLLANGRRMIALAVVDQTSMPMDQVAAIQARISGLAHIAPSDVVVVASHTFSAPHAFDASHLPPGMTLSPEDSRRGTSYRTAILEAVSGATAAAAGTMRPSRLAFGFGRSDVNVNRNHKSADGWWLGADDTGYSDKALGILSIRSLDGKPIATFVNFAVQSSVMDHSIGADGMKSVTSDLGGAAASRLEAMWPESVAFFLTGAAGDQMPAYTARRNIYDASGGFRTQDIGDKGQLLVEVQGERLADAVIQTDTDRMAAAPDLQIVHGTVSLDGQERPKDLQQIRATRTYRFVAAGKVQAPYVVVLIGDTAIVGVQAELSATTGAYLRAKSPFKHTLVVTMVNGAAKYMPDQQAYRDITYEAMNSSFAPGAAERFTDAILAKLRDVSVGRPPN